MIFFISLQHTEYESMVKDVNRSAYTKRILEIVSNIAKQKQQIDQVGDCFYLMILLVLLTHLKHKIIIYLYVNYALLEISVQIKWT